MNAPLIVKQPGTTLVDPNRWQPLALDLIVTQNGIPLPDKVQTRSARAGTRSTPFALTRSDPNDVYIDPGSAAAARRRPATRATRRARAA